MSSKTKVAVVTLAKNENHYIREWIEYHKSIGVDKFYIGDNNEVGDDSLTKVLEDYIKDEIVNVIDIRGQIRPQRRFLSLTISNISEGYDWVGVFDIDEFVRLNGFDNIGNFLSQEKFSNIGQVGLYWKYYTDNGLLDVVDDNYSITRFTEPINKIPYSGKAFIHTNRSKFYGQVRPHGVNGMTIVNYNGDKIKKVGISYIGKEPIVDVAWVDHYMTKTCGEFIRNKYFRKSAVVEQNDRRSSIDFFFKFKKKTKKKENYMKKIIEELTTQETTTDEKEKNE